MLGSRVSRNSSRASSKDYGTTTTMYFLDGNDWALAPPNDGSFRHWAIPPVNGK